MDKDGDAKRKNLKRASKRYSCIGNPPLPERLIEALASYSARLYAEGQLPPNGDHPPAVSEKEESDAT